LPSATRVRRKVSSPCSEAESANLTQEGKFVNEGSRDDPSEGRKPSSGPVPEQHLPACDCAYDYFPASV